MTYARSWWIVIGLIVVAYGLSLWNHLVYEEVGQVYHFAWSSSTIVAMLTRPTRQLSLLLGTSNPFLAHLENFGLHLTVALLAGWLATRLGLEGWIVAGLVGLHPIMSQAVLYAFERMELMTAVGILIACLGATVPNVWGGFTVGIGAFVAMASKESGVVVVGLVPLIALFQPRRKTLWEQSKWLLVPLLAGVFVALEGLTWLRYIDSSEGLHVPATTWINQMFGGLGRLLGHYVWPSNFSIEHLTPLSTAGMTLIPLLAALSVYVVWQGIEADDTMPLLAVGWFWVSVLPRFFFRLPLSFFPEHQWYVPSIGISLGMAWWLQRYSDRVVWTILAILTLLTVNQTMIWHDNLTLWAHAVDVEACSPRAHANLSMAYDDAGRATDAEMERILMLAAAKTCANGEEQIAGPKITFPIPGTK